MASFGAMNTSSRLSGVVQSWRKNHPCCSNRLPDLAVAVIVTVTAAVTATVAVAVKDEPNDGKLLKC